MPIRSFLSPPPIGIAKRDLRGQYNIADRAHKLTHRKDFPFTQEATFRGLHHDVYPEEGRLSLELQGLSATNIVVNGNFLTETTANFSFTNASQVSLVAPELTFLASAQFGRIQQTFVPIVGHKYYASVWVKANSSQARLELYLNNSGASSIHTGSNNYERLSLVSTCTNESGATRTSVVDGRTSDWTNISCKYFMVINMTTLGLDHLTTEQMNTLFPYYFEGTQHANPNIIKVIGKNLLELSYENISFDNLNQYLEEVILDNNEEYTLQITLDEDISDPIDKILLYAKGETEEFTPLTTPGTYSLTFKPINNRATIGLLGNVWEEGQFNFERATTAYDSVGNEIEVGMPVFEEGLRITEGTYNHLHFSNSRKFEYLKEKYYDQVKHLLFNTNGQLSVALGGQSRRNILTENQSSVETDLTGFSKQTAGDTITRDSTESLFGEHSVKLVTGNVGANEGFITTPVVVSESKTYTASIYIKGSGTMIFGIREGTSDGSIVDITNSEVITLTTAWQRVSVTSAFGATGKQARLNMLIDVQQEATFYVDGLMIEESDTLNNFILGGSTKSTLSQTLVSVNENTFDKSKIVKGEYYNSSGDILSGVEGTWRTPYYIPVTVGHTYYTSELRLISQYDANKNHISRVATDEYTPLAGVSFVRISTGNTPTDENVFMMSPSPITSYVPHTHTKSLATWGEAGEGRSVPNGTKDEVRDGVHYKRVSDNKLLSSSLSGELNTNAFENVDVILIAKNNFENTINNGDLSGKRITIGNLTLLQNQAIDDEASVGKIYETSGNFVIIVEKDKYPNYNDAMADFDGVALNYQLENEIVEEIDPFFIIKKDEDGLSPVSEMESFEDGTVYTYPITSAYEEPVADVITLSTENGLVDLEYVYLNSGTDSSPTWTDVTEDCSLDTNTGEVTITDSDDTKKYLVVATVSPENSTAGEKVIHYPVTEGNAEEAIELNAGTYTISVQDESGGELIIHQAGQSDTIITSGESHTLTLPSKQEIILSTTAPVWKVQVENKPYPTLWHLGHKERDTDICWYDLTGNLPDKFAIGIWIRPFGHTGQNKHLLSLYKDEDNYISPFINSTGGISISSIKDATPDTQILIPSVSINDYQILGAYLVFDGNKCKLYISLEGDISESDYVSILKTADVSKLLLGRGQETDTNMISATFTDLSLHTRIQDIDPMDFLSNPPEIDDSEAFIQGGTLII